MQLRSRLTQRTTSRAAHCSLSNSIAARLALGNGALLVALIVVISGVFYFGTVGVLDRSMDGKIISISNRLLESYRQRARSTELAREINHELTDGIDSDTEIFLVTSPPASAWSATLSQWPAADDTARSSC